MLEKTPSAVTPCLPPQNFSHLLFSAAAHIKAPEIFNYWRILIKLWTAGLLWILQPVVSKMLLAGVTLIWI